MMKAALMLEKSALDSRLLQTTYEFICWVNCLTFKNLAIDTIKDIGLKGYEGLKSDDFNDAEESLVSEIIEKLIKVSLWNILFTFDNFQQISFTYNSFQMYLFTDINAKSAVFGKFLEYLPLMRKPKAAAASAGKIMVCIYGKSIVLTLIARQEGPCWRLPPFVG